MGFIKQFLEPFVRNMKNFALITRFYTQDGRFVRIVAMHRGKYRPRQPEIMVTLRTVFIDITSHHPFLYNIYIPGLVSPISTMASPLPKCKVSELAIIRLNISSFKGYGDSPSRSFSEFRQIHFIIACYLTLVKACVYSLKIGEIDPGWGLFRFL